MTDTITVRQVQKLLDAHATRMAKITADFGKKDLKESVDELLAEFTRIKNVVLAFDLQELMARAPR